MNPGLLRERVTIQQNTKTADSQGGFSSSWGTLAIVAAQVTPLSGREVLQAASIGSEVAFRAVIRTRTDVRPTMRLQWTPSWASGAPTKTLEISAVRPDLREPTAYLELDCAERV